MKKKSRQDRGISKEFIAALLTRQRHKCAVCECPISSKAALDHDHQTGKTRGLLCIPCNVAEGMILRSGLDPFEFAEKLAYYLAHPPALFVRVFECAE